MIEVLLRLLLFAIPASARSWRGLAWRAGISIALILAGLLVITGGRLSMTTPTGDADIAAGILIYLALMSLVLGLIARTVSLAVRRLGHHRPWSLWIEAAFFIGFPVAFDLWLEAG